VTKYLHLLTETFEVSSFYIDTPRLSRTSARTVS